MHRSHLNATASKAWIAGRRPAMLSETSARTYSTADAAASVAALRGMPMARFAALSTRHDFAGLRTRPPAGREMPVIPFFVQIKCHLGKSYSVANALADAEIASEIYSTAGDFDLLVKFYVEQGTDIGHFVNEKVQTIPGIQDTRTIITFKAF
jgi:DNA-binding Lrp family transcriptional regulator